METAYNSQHSVRVRFAPSPTGMLHIGGARTALFNYLFARHMGGTFLLRIEDTDRERSTPENTQIILNSLKWLDIKPDEAPVYQSQRLQLHRAAVEKLLDEGKAYHDDGAVRFKIPEGGTSWEDNVQGRITYKNEQLEDFVIRRSDGTPTYHLAVVVDDIDMAITHIIRGDDHINNTPKQILLYQALGAPLPAFAHVPLIHGADGKKLSKRHGSVSVTSYQESGFLPQALNNYLLRLGWAHKDEEILPRERAIELFTLGGIGRGAAVFDPMKIVFLNY